MTALLALRGISVRFGGLLALDRFTMTVDSGSIHALIGPNGAGKSTAFNCISRFCTPFSGDIVFDGRSLLGEKPHRVAARGIARTFQNIELLARLTVLENVLVGLTSLMPWTFAFAPGRRRAAVERHALRDAEAVLDETGLLGCRDLCAGELDFGRQKRLDLARALAGGPRLLLLDEPAAGLRNREIAEIDAILIDLARRRGITIVLVEHVMRLVMSVADRVTVLNFGATIAEGGAAEIAANPAVVEAYLGRDSDDEAVCDA